jgi:hypothetical protein
MNQRLKIYIKLVDLQKLFMAIFCHNSLPPFIEKTQLLALRIKENIAMFNGPRMRRSSCHGSQLTET